ncbi:hypothetical protein MP228_012689 [Amoeboaphelidium protococcarum]|nr:hypothetical protein MP228_012689 [Amoeboaphelidium protococcarum]
MKSPKRSQRPELLMDDEKAIDQMIVFPEDKTTPVTKNDVAPNQAETSKTKAAANKKSHQKLHAGLHKSVDGSWKCTSCGCPENLTPVKRIGPSGQRDTCNACYIRSRAKKEKGMRGSSRPTGVATTYAMPVISGYQAMGTMNMPDTAFVNSVNSYAYNNPSTSVRTQSGLTSQFPQFEFGMFGGQDFYQQFGYAINFDQSQNQVNALVDGNSGSGNNQAKSNHHAQSPLNLLSPGAHSPNLSGLSPGLESILADGARSAHGIKHKRDNDGDQGHGDVNEEGQAASYSKYQRSEVFEVNSAQAVSGSHVQSSQKSKRNSRASLGQSRSQQTQDNARGSPSMMM